MFFICKYVILHTYYVKNKDYKNNDKNKGYDVPYKIGPKVYDIGGPISYTPQKQYIITYIVRRTPPWNNI